MPEETKLKSWAAANGVSGGPEDVCKDPRAAAYYLEELTATGKEGKLKGFELVKIVHLDANQFTVEVGTNPCPGPDPDLTELVVLHQPNSRLTHRCCDTQQLGIATLFFMAACRPIAGQPVRAEEVETVPLLYTATPTCRALALAAFARALGLG